MPRVRGQLRPHQVRRCPRGTSLKDKLLAYSVPVPFSGCWLWLGAIQKHGYGIIRDAKCSLAPRAAWVAFRGEIPGGMNVLHKCDTPLCINPDHLFLGTQADNLADMVQKNRSRRGERNRNAKLRTHQVLAIRDMEGSALQIAKSFGISPRLVLSIKKGTAWNHLPWKECAQW